MRLKDRQQLQTELQANPAEAWRRRAREATSKHVKKVYEEAAQAIENGDDDVEDPDPSYDEEMRRAEEELAFAQRKTTFLENFIFGSRKGFAWLSLKLAPFFEKYTKVMSDGWWFFPLAIFAGIHFFALHGFAACLLLAVVPFLITFVIGAISEQNKYRHHTRLVTIFFLVWAITANFTAFKTTIVSEDGRLSLDCGNNNPKNECDTNDHPMEVRGSGRVLFTWISKSNDSFFDFRSIPATLFTSNTLEWIKLEQPEAYKTQDPLVDVANLHKREIYQTVVSYGLKMLPYDKSVGIKSGGLKAESELIQKQIVSTLKTLKTREGETLPSEKVFQEVVTKVKNPFFQVVNIQAVRTKISTEFLEEGEWWIMVRKSSQ